MEGQQCGLVYVPGYPRRVGPSSGNLQVRLSRELPSKTQLRIICTGEVTGVMTRKRRIKPSPRDILQRRMGFGHAASGCRPRLPGTWEEPSLPACPPGWGLLGLLAATGFVIAQGHPWEPLGVVRLVSFWAQMSPLSVPGGTGVHVQPHRGHRRTHHAQGLCHGRVAGQPGATGIPGLHEVRGHPGVGVLGVKLGAPPRRARALCIHLRETSAAGSQSKEGRPNRLGAGGSH